ncbi:MAG: putative collagen-binding domain-containing protein, partial [Bacteroidota bacterium]
ALDFFRNNDIPYWEMESHDEMILTEKDYCFAKPGEVYVFLAKKGTTKVDLSSEAGEMSVRWYNPRTGGELQKGKVKKVTAGKEVDLGKSPDKDEKDWVIVVRK